MRVAAMLLMTLKGTPFFYMGDEIGRERVPIPPDRVQISGPRLLFRGRSFFEPIKA